MGQSIRTVPAVAAMLILAAIAGCVEESSIPVIFDQELKSVAFDNKLLTPVVLYRDLQPFDTLPARTHRVYELNRKGIIRHAWRIIPPTDQSGRAAGVAPHKDLGIQYAIEAEYVIDNTAPEHGTIFTPRIANFSSDYVRLIANYRESDEFESDYLVPPNSLIDDSHAPYYYWHSSSNIFLISIGSSFGTLFRRGDSTGYGLEMDYSSSYNGSGATIPITVR